MGVEPYNSGIDSELIGYLCGMKNLPIGLQTLPEFREMDCIYVDKTRLVYQLVTRGKYYFL